MMTLRLGGPDEATHSRLPTVSGSEASTESDRPAAPEPPSGDALLIGRLRSGDEAAFRQLVIEHHRALIHVAMHYVSSNAVAEEVVQETWLGVIKGISTFEGRSSLKTWIFRILENKARTRGVREQRTVPFASLNTEDDRPDVDPTRLQYPGYPGHWSQPPRALGDLPAQRVEGKEARAVIEAAIRQLPSNHQRVIWLRDVEGWTSDEVCDALMISEANQRVLLHRARSKVRAAYERYLDGGDS
jgi:RNA polymerase sigma-70 factor (ECF subfamily)